MNDSQLIEDKIDVELIAKEVFKKAISDMPAEKITPEVATQLYVDIYKRVWAESGKLIRNAAVNEDDVSSKYIFK